MSNRRIKFLARDLPFPTDPTFREYRLVEELTGVTADQIMTGTAGVWMLPVLAIVATVRADSNVTRQSLERILDLNPGDINLEGDFNTEDDASPPDPQTTSTGTESTDVTPEESGVQA